MRKDADVLRESRRAERGAAGSARRSRATFPVALCALLGVSRVALAGPPLLSDDPETPGDRNWEVNVDSRVTWGRHVLGVEGPTLDVNYGVGDRRQLKFEIPFVHDQADGEDARSGIGAATLGVKWRFLDQDARGISMSVYPQLEVASLTSLARLGDKERGPGAILPFQVQHAFEGWKLGADAGRRLGQMEDGWFGGVWAGKEVRKGFDLLAEIHGESPDRDDPSLFLDAGTKFALDEHTSLLFSAGIDTLAAGGDGHAATLFLGLQFTF